MPPKRKATKATEEVVENGSVDPVAGPPKAKKERSKKIEKEVEQKVLPARSTRAKAAPPPAKEEKSVRNKVKKTKATAEPEEEAPAKKKEAQPKGKKAVPAAKPKAKAKTTKGSKKTADDDTDDEPQPSKSSAKQAKKSSTPSEPTATKKAPQNQTSTDYDSIDFESEKLNADTNPPNLKISSWNVDGLRAWLKKDGLKYIKYESPDILCLQETKCSEEKIPEEMKDVEGYTGYWCSSEKEGYAGVALLTKREPLEVKYGIEVEEFDEEGRCITAEYEGFYLVNVYVPNAGRKLVTLPKRLEWNVAFQNYINELDEKKPVIICGDMNVAHAEIDLSNPKTNKKNAGFTQEERDGLTDFLGDRYVDTFRSLYPDRERAYTFWSYMSNARAKDIGWRLDYFIVSERLNGSVCDNVIRTSVFGSDHCPITLFLNMME